MYIYPTNNDCTVEERLNAFTHDLALISNKHGILLSVTKDEPCLNVTILGKDAERSGGVEMRSEVELLWYVMTDDYLRYDMSITHHAGGKIDKSGMADPSKLDEFGDVEGGTT